MEDYLERQSNSRARLRARLSRESGMLDSASRLRTPGGPGSSYPSTPAHGTAGRGGGVGGGGRDNDVSIALQRSQRSILLENQLDLNESELEYYEQVGV